MSKNTKNSFLMNYKKADAESRFKIMMYNYAIFPKEIRKAEKKLQFKIKAEQEWARSQARDELGVRVQKSKLGDQTANEAITNVMIEEAFENGYLDKSLLRGIADTSEYEEEFHLICVMKMDYELLGELIEGLPVYDSKLMKMRFVQGLFYKEIADSESTTYEAVKRRIERICKEIKDEILEYLEMNSERK